MERVLAITERLAPYLRPFGDTPEATVLSTGLPTLDGIMPRGGLEPGAVHELLVERPGCLPLSAAVLMARSAMPRGAVVWSDPRGELHPLAVASGGIRIGRLYLLRPRSPADELWAVTECLRCKAVGATIAAPTRLSQVEARRLQLAAERGGGIGILLRPAGRSSAHYAAATRWLVRPAPGTATVQRWTVELIHGHGGRLNHPVVLEVDRETNLVRASETVAHRPAEAKTPRASA